MDEVIVYEVVDGVARITMNRPDKRNAESVALIRDRDEALSRAVADPDVRVIVFGAAGPAFSAGHDTVEIFGDEEIARQRSTVAGTVAFERRTYYETALRIQQCPKPTIAMVRGACVAGGLMTAAMCDLVVASRDARFREPVAGFAELPGSAGPRPGAASTEVFFLGWQVGVRKAKEMLFTGGWMDAEEAKAVGFVNRVVEPERLESETMDLARRVALADPAAVALLKQSFNHMLDGLGMRASYEYHFILHQLRHAGVDASWLMPTAEEG